MQQTRQQRTEEHKEREFQKNGEIESEAIASDLNYRFDWNIFLSRQSDPMANQMENNLGL